MGNSKSNVIGSSGLADFDNESLFTVKNEKQESDIFNYDILLYNDIKRNCAIACVEKAECSTHFTDIQIEELNLRLANKTQSLLQLRGYCSYVKSSSFCGTSFSQCLFVDYPVATLKDEIAMRQYYEQPFTEVELWGFLRSVLFGLLELQRIGKPCRNISSSTIYIDYTGSYQISELGLVKDSSLLDEIFLRILSKDMYLSPQQIEVLKEVGTLHDSSNAFSSDIFSLGVVLLEMIYLNDQSPFFTYTGDNINVDIAGLIEMLNLREKTHSKVLLFLIQQMIQHEEADRIQLPELFDQANRNYFRVYSNYQLNVESKRPVDQHRTEYVSKLMNRKEIETEYDKKQYQQRKEVEEPVRRRRGDANKNRKYTCRPVFQEEASSSSSIFSLAKDGGAGPTAASNNVSMMSASSSSTSTARNILLRGFEKLHGHSLMSASTGTQPGAANSSNSNIHLTMHFAEIVKLKLEQEKLIQQQTELESVEIKTREIQSEISDLAKRILENAEQQSDLQRQMQQQQLQNTVQFAETIAEDVEEDTHVSARLGGGGGGEHQVSQKRKQNINVASKIPLYRIIGSDQSMNNTPKEFVSFDETMSNNTPQHNAPYPTTTNKILMGSRFANVAAAGGGNQTPLNQGLLHVGKQYIPLHQPYQQQGSGSGGAQSSSLPRRVSYTPKSQMFAVAAAAAADSNSRRAANITPISKRSQSDAYSWMQSSAIGMGNTPMNMAASLQATTNHQNNNSSINMMVLNGTMPSHASAASKHDRYDLRLSRHNVCTNRYDAIQQVFSEKKPQLRTSMLENSGFKSVVVDKKSISDILMSNSKRIPSAECNKNNIIITNGSKNIQTERAANHSHVGAAPTEFNFSHEKNNLRSSSSTNNLRELRNKNIISQPVRNNSTMAFNRAAFMNDTDN